ncbi:MAG TPA: amino acid adenylation domain-containing protein, partial [Thermoanaerobaculia bacterium]|nr:amino acid adenylation domain-containing protein [Thermoanaerobaculia bacterium]
LIGFFVNTLVLRTGLAGDPGFGELAARVREVTLDAYAHQDLPFEMLVGELQPERDLSRTPLFQVMLTLQNAPMEPLELPGLRLEPLGAPGGTALFDLTLNISEDEAGIAGAAEYSTDLFEAVTIERLLTHLTVLLSAAVAVPDTPVASLPLLTEGERRQLLLEWNDTGRPFPDHLGLHELVEQQAALAPGAFAVIDRGTDRGATLTFGDLDRRAGLLAARLRAHGVGPECVVAICVERSANLAVAILGVLKAGSAYLPLDPEHPLDRLAGLIEDSGAALLLTREGLIERFSALGAAVLPVDGPAPSAPAPVRPVHPESSAYVIFTSGSTGRPKGVVVPHQALVHYTLEMVRGMGLGPSDRVLQFAPVSFDVLAEELFPTWAAGGAVVFDDPDRLRSPLQLHRAIEEAGVTWTELPAPYWQEWVRELESGRARFPSTLRLLVVGSEKPAPESLAVWQRFGVELIYIFGLTETTITSSFHRLAGGDDLDLPIGRPIANTSLYVLDGALEPLPVAVPGELLIGGEGVARGYLGRPDLTAERFIPDPFAARPGARLYRTGDRARMRVDGSVDFLGRLDHQVKIRGFRVEPGEIERRLEEHPAVRDAAVLVREDRLGDRRLVAYVVTEAAEGDLREFLRQRLPEYMVPSAFVPLAALPLTPHGKLDRRALPAPEPEVARTSEGTAPRSPVEEVLAGIFRDVLARDRVGIHDGFFDLGGHSLLATRVISRVRDAFGVELPLRRLFESPTVAGLAPEIAAILGSGPAAPPLVPVRRDQPLPLSFAQQRLWFLDRLEPGSSTYNVPSAVRLDGAVDVAALAAALG